MDKYLHGLLQLLTRRDHARLLASLRPQRDAVLSLSEADNHAAHFRVRVGLRSTGRQKTQVADVAMAIIAGRTVAGGRWGGEGGGMDHVRKSRKISPGWLVYWAKLRRR